TTTFGNDGGGLLSGPCAEGILDYPEWRGNSRALLLRISLFVRRRGGGVGTGFYLAGGENLNRPVVFCNGGACWTRGTKKRIQSVCLFDMPYAAHQRRDIWL